MTHTPHELATDFPDHADRIAQLRQNDAHFARLAEAYDDINNEVHRAETNIEPTSDHHMTEMRRNRMQLKDAIFTILTG